MRKLLNNVANANQVNRPKSSSLLLSPTIASANKRKSFMDGKSSRDILMEVAKGLTKKKTTDALSSAVADAGATSPMRRRKTIM